MSALALPAAPPSMTPGTYLRLCRQRACVTIQGVARATVSSPVDIAAAIEALGNAEADRELLGDADLARVATAIRFVPDVYLRLVDGGPATGICIGCGCSQNDACDEHGRACAWADRDETVCTACLRKSA